MFGFRLRVSVPGVRAQDSGLRVSGFGCMFSGSGFHVQAFGFRVSGLGSGFQVQGVRSRPSGPGHSLCFSTAVQERCPPRQTSRVECLTAKVEPLSSKGGLQGYL